MIHTTVQFGRSISEDRAKAVVIPAFNDLPSGSWSFKLWYERIWDVDRTEDRISQPRRARISAASKDLEVPVATERSKLSIRFPSLSPEFANLYGDSEARWTNVLKLRSYGNEESIALVLPSDFTSEKFPRLRLTGCAFASREGLVLPQRHKNHGEYLSLLTGTQAIIEWLGQHGVEAISSDAGRIADQVLSAIGGFSGAYLFADSETIKLLDGMAKSVRRYKDGTVEEFEDRATSVEVWEKLISRRKSQQLSPRLSLDEFVKANILKLGLSIECPNCTKKNWCSLHSLDEQVTCERCLKEFNFPQGGLNFRNTPWQYRVVGPFSVPGFAAGAYATVLALRLFSQNLGSHAQITCSTSLEIKSGQGNLKEIDFTFWYLRDYFIEQDEEPVLVFGEAKSFASQSFKPEDVNRMEILATTFPGAFLVFATLKEALSDEERSMIGKLALWGREPLANGLQRAPVIVLTGTELFSDWHVTQAWKGCDDKRSELAASHLQVDNLWNLADLTQQVYLGLPDKYAELRQRLTSHQDNH
jgi:ribosomal protein S27E